MQQRVAKAWSKLGYNPIPGYVVDISTELSLFFDNDDDNDNSSIDGDVDARMNNGGHNQLFIPSKGKR